LDLIGQRISRRLNKQPGSHLNLVPMMTNSPRGTPKVTNMSGSHRPSQQIKPITKHTCNHPKTHRQYPNEEQALTAIMNEDLVWWTTPGYLRPVISPLKHRSTVWSSWAKSSAGGQLEVESQHHKLAQGLQPRGQDLESHRRELARQRRCLGGVSGNAHEGLRHAKLLRHVQYRHQRLFAQRQGRKGRDEELLGRMDHECTPLRRRLRTDWLHGQHKRCHIRILAVESLQHGIRESRGFDGQQHFGPREV